MRWLGLIALAAGCEFSAQLGRPDGQPPPDVRGPDGPPGDVDADGVPNATDNCPDDSNPEQWNEDMDARGDACDPCPQLGSAVVGGDDDSDGDGVGNGCDPRPDAGGDELAYWNGFHVASAGLPAGMTMVAGSATRWSVAGGALVFAAADGDWGIPAVDVGGARHTTDATFEIVQSFPTLTAAAAGVTVDIAADGLDLFDCQARTNIQGRELWRRDPNAFAGWDELDTASAPTTNATYRITLQRTATDLACVTVRDGDGPVGVSSNLDSQGNTRAGLFARNVNARFFYLAIYRSP